MFGPSITTTRWRIDNELPKTNHYCSWEKERDTKREIQRERERDGIQIKQNT